jgi:hypothetical protein
MRRWHHNCLGRLLSVATTQEPQLQSDRNALLISSLPASSHVLAAAHDELVNFSIVETLDHVHGAESGRTQDAHPQRQYLRFDILRWSTRRSLRPSAPPKGSESNAKVRPLQLSRGV